MADFISQMEDARQNVNSLEEMLGKNLNVPYAGASSGSREIMSSTHQSHTLVLTQAEPAYVQTGYENRFGERSSSIITSNANYEVLAKVSKFSYCPNHQYYLILRNVDDNSLDVLERKSYHFRTEVYGYLLNNSLMDSYAVPGAFIPKDTVLRRSTAFDKYGNRTSGANLITAYMSTDKNMEDSVIISDYCSKRMSAPLVRDVEIILNENDIPLNIYGDDEVYKVFPDIGEDVKDGILLSYRREKREEAIYAQSVKRLQQIMMSDDKITVKGKVIDIDIYCNNPDYIEKSAYNQQFNAYYKDRQRMNEEITNIVGPYKAQGHKMSYNLQKLYDRSLGELNKKTFVDKSKFSYLEICFTVMEDRILGVGDKVADRYGGKGVVSKIVPTELMPKLPNGRYVDIIKNSSTMYGRENTGQAFELELNYISMCILDKIRSEAIPPEDAIEMIIKYVTMVSQELGDELRATTNRYTQEELTYFVESYLQKVSIPISNKPMTEIMTIDKLGAIYQAFPWITQTYVQVPVKNSVGQYRFVRSRRPVIISPIYCIRLKQFSEEKFSATALSSTNIKNENAKSKASKNYKEPNSNTPIKFGQMESGDMDHMGAEYVVTNLLMLSLSPHARRLVEQIATGDPYNVDVKLDTRSKNRSAEILNTRLKTMGYRLTFSKVKKHKPLGAFIPGVEFFERSPGHPIEGVEFVEDGYDYKHWYDTLREIEEIRKHNAVEIMGVSFIDDYQQPDEEEK